MSSIAVGQVALAAAAVQVVAARAGRKSLRLLVGGPSPASPYLGITNAVTTANGYRIPQPNAEFVMDCESAVWAIGGNGQLQFMEVF